MLSFLRKKMKTIIIVVAVLFAASIFYGMGRGIMDLGKQRQSSAFLKVNGKSVSPLRYRQILMQLRRNFPEEMSPEETLFLQNLALSQTIDFVIMLQDARKNEKISGRELNRALEEMSKQQGFKSVSEFKKALASMNSEYSWNDIKRMVREDMLVQKRVGKIRGEQRVDPRDLREVRARHILVRVENGKKEEARKEIDGLLNRAKKGEDFGKLAKQYSDDPGTATKGGDLGFFSTGSMVKPFEDLAFSLKVGDVGGPIETVYGYHIIKIEDARLRKIEGETDIEKAVLRQKQESAFRDWFYKLKQAAKVEINDPSLRALDLRFKGRMGEAVVEYNQAIAGDPGNSYLRLALGLLYEESGQMDNAIQQYKKMVELSPGDAGLYIILGRAYQKNSQNSLALEQYNKASLIAGDRISFHQDLMSIYKEFKRPDLEAKERDEIFRIEKKEAFEKALKEEAKVKTE